MEENNFNVTPSNKQNNGMMAGIVIGLLIALVVGMGAFIAYDKVLSKNKDNKENTPVATPEPTSTPEPTATPGSTPTPTTTPVKEVLSDEDAKKKGEELYKYAYSNLMENNGIVEHSTDSSKYLDSSKSDKCNFGIGCLPITNWSKVSEKFTDKFISTLDYSKRGDKNRFSLVMIDSNPYAIDGWVGYSLDKIESVGLLYKDKETIRFIVKAVVIDGEGVCGEKEEPCKYEYTSTLAIKLENDVWKIDEFTMEKVS